MEFDHLDSRTGKSWNFFQVMKSHGLGKYVCSIAAYCSGLSEMYAGKHIKLWQDVNLL